MKIRLHEIELGTGSVEDATRFFQSALGLQTTLKQESLTVFDAGVNGLDFNISTHLGAWRCLD
jgi:catechol 2,3-dioxygenase-like lactoylglutathione lyase family enzyme